MRKTTKLVLSFIIVTSIFLGSSITANAVNTVFDVPTIDPNMVPDNVIYQSPNCNLQVSKWHYGLVADMINTSNLDTLISELNVNVSTAGYGRSILGIYPNGANLSDANAQAIRDAGWTEVDLYYDTFLITGSAPTGGMIPSIQRVENPEILTALGDNYSYDSVAIVNVADVKMATASFFVYDEAFRFLNGKKSYAYKYIADINKFIYLPESYCGSYASGIIEVYDLHNAEDDVNGVYVILAEEIPAELLTTKEEIPVLKEELQKEESRAQWSFETTEEPEGFTADATVSVRKDTEILVDFAYSGELPVGTEVTIKIPEKGHCFNENDILYFYYYNREKDIYEYVDESVYMDGKVTFQINHCSEYIITSEKIEENVMIEDADISTTTEPDTDINTGSTSQDNSIPKILAGGVIVTACVVLGLSIGLVIKKKKHR